MEFNIFQIGAILAYLVTILTSRGFKSTLLQVKFHLMFFEQLQASIDSMWALHSFVRASPYMFLQIISGYVRITQR